MRGLPHDHFAAAFLLGNRRAGCERCPGPMCCLRTPAARRAWWVVIVARPHWMAWLPLPPLRPILIMQGFCIVSSRSRRPAGGRWCAGGSITPSACNPSLAFPCTRATSPVELVVFHAVASPYRDRSHFDGQTCSRTGLTKPLGSAERLAQSRALAALPRGTTGA